MQLNELPERGRIHEWLITREQNHRVEISCNDGSMLYTDTDRRAHPVRPVWVLDNRNRKPGQPRCDLCRTCANDDHDRSASSVFCGRNDTPNEWFALKNRELLWLSEADRTTGGEYDRGHSHRTIMQPLPWQWVPWGGI